MKNINFLSGSRSWFTHVNSASEATFFTHDLFTSGDYCGGSVQAANRRVLLENTQLCERLGIEELNESYSTDTLLFPLDAIKDPELLEIFEGLDNYPLLDEAVLSEVEHELEVECFDSFGRDDFKDMLRDNDLITEDQFEDISNETLDAIFWAASRETNYNVFTVESGTSGFFDFESFGGLYDKKIDLLKKIIKETLK
jgi:hypothetical protein